MKANRWVVIVGLAVAAGGCGGAEVVDDVPAGFDENALGETVDKADWAGVLWVKHEGPIACADTRTGKTGPISMFDGYTFKSTTGAKIGFDATANHRARLLLFGPKKANGQWGGVKLSSWLSYNAQAKAFRSTVKFTAPADGTYLVVLGSYTTVPVQYELAYYCDSKPHCVEYIATDDQGSSLRNFYAINVNSYKEGKDHLAQLQGRFIEEAITPGSCQSLSTICAKIYKPVCAADITPDNGPEPRQFGNVCEFKAAVRQTAASSTWNGAKGHYDDGECKPTRCTPGDKQYMGTPQTCPLIKFTCAFDQGYSYFSDSKGCGCECKDLHWYFTCGTPVCMAPDSPAATDPAYLAIPVCSAQQQDGSPCTSEGDVCRPAVYSCGRLIKCQASRPTVCPISQRAKKHDIRYLDADALAKFTKELLGVKLATYQYNEAPAGAPRRLGFIIEDTASKVAVDSRREHVDLYGYTSLAVAALQVQSRKLEALEREVAALRKQLARRSR